MVFDLAVNSRFTSNLLLDSSAFHDWISSLSGGARYYPTSSTEIGAGAAITRHSRFQRADNVRTDLGFTQIFSGRRGHARSFVEAGWERRVYHRDNEVLDHTVASVAVAWTSNPETTPFYRMGLRANATEYPHAPYANHWQVEAYGGFNVIVWGRNSLDVEAGFGLIGLRAIDAPFRLLDPRDPEAFLIDTGLTTVYISPRWSRPIGANTGVSLQYMHRYPIRGGDLELYGFSSGYLSPWADAFYGPDFVLQVRTLHFAPLTADAGIGYARRYYLYILSDLVGPVFSAERRWDHHGLLFSTARRPLSFTGITGLDATATLQFVMNRSTMKLYDYTEVTAFVGLTWTP